MRRIRVDVVIPVYNEEQVLARSVGRLHQFLSAWSEESRESWAPVWRIVVADNASVDQTRAIARQLERDLPRVGVLHLPEKGRGRALRRAWLESDAEILSYMDVDLSTGLEAFPPLIAAIAADGYALATGSRLLRASQTTRSFKRETISRAYNMLIRATLRTHFSDAQCGFKAISRAACDDLVPRVQDQGWFFDTELLVLAERCGYRIKDVPVRWIEDTDSRVRLGKTIRDDLRGLWRLRHSLPAKAEPDHAAAATPVSVPVFQPSKGERGSVRRESGLQPSLNHGAAVSAPDFSPRPETVRQGAAGGRERLRRLARVCLRPEPLALSAVLLLAAALNLIELGGEGYGNTYYAAAVRSMAQNWHNFFFASFDGSGFVSVDKPPLGLWVQTASVKLFGFHGLSLLLPQALAGIGSVALLYLLVRRCFGAAAALLAALALAVTPISVVTDRNNTQDALLVFVLLLAAWALLRAVRTGRLAFLLLCAALVGAGFNIKMLQAYLVVPAFALTYLLGSPLRWRTRLWHLALAGCVLLVVSLSWAVVVDLTPVTARPYVGSSGSNSELSLILGYNGLGRLTEALPGWLRSIHLFGTPLDLSTAPAFAPGIGSTGPLRLLNQGLAGQASWLLLPAVLGLLAAAARLRRKLPLDAAGQSVVLWGGWLLAAAGYFSVARFFHPYYLIMLAPPVAALFGIGVVALWHLYRRRLWLGLALPAMLIAAALAQRHILAGYATWNAQLTPWLLAAALIAAALLGATRLLRGGDRRLPLAATVMAALALLAAPGVWSAISVQNGAGGSWIPQAGPSNGPDFAGAGPGPARGGLGFGRGARPAAFAADGPGPSGNATRANGGSTSAPNGGGFGGGPARPGGVGGFGGGQGAMTFAGANWDALDPALVAYLEQQQGSTRNLVATPTSSYASLFIVASGRSALALGGYQGWDRIVTPAQLAQLVAQNAVRFFLIPANARVGQGPGAGPDQDVNTDLYAWVRASCASVPASTWQGGTATSGISATSTSGLSLYRCGG